jgi:hypothetical protein
MLLRFQQLLIPLLQGISKEGGGLEVDSFRRLIWQLLTFIIYKTRLFLQKLVSVMSLVNNMEKLH